MIIMAKKGSGWKNESRRHSLARKGVKTVIDDHKRLAVNKFVANGKVYTANELKTMPTILSGHFDNLKIDKGDLRVWLSRLTIADGMPYNDQVTIERKINGNWVVVDQYQG